VIAASGGVFVFAGLLMERFSEKDWHKNLSDFRRSKSRMVWGEWIVIAGIVMEIFVAGWTAVEEWQTRQIAISNDPLNQPIKSMTVEAVFLIKGTNFFDFDSKFLQMPAPKAEWVSIIGKDGNDPTLAVLRCKEFRSVPGEILPTQQTSKETDLRTFFLSFSWPNVDPVAVLAAQRNVGLSWISAHNASAYDLDKQMTAAVVGIAGIQDQEEIISGMCVLTINGSIQRRFSIPKYNINGGQILCPLMKPN
jgi:hypothetical protein